MNNLSVIIPNDGVFLLIDRNPITARYPITSNNTCIVYDVYEYCLNKGECFDERNSPTCRCTPTSKYSYFGDFCEAAKEKENIPGKTSTSKPSQTALILSIVLPMIAFIILAILLFLALYFCYKRYKNLSFFQLNLQINNFSNLL